MGLRFLLNSLHGDSRTLCPDNPESELRPCTTVSYLCVGSVLQY